jgi:hypothetical protein
MHRIIHCKMVHYTMYLSCMAAQKINLHGEAMHRIIHCKMVHYTMYLSCMAVQKINLHGEAIRRRRLGAQHVPKAPWCAARTEGALTTLCRFGEAELEEENSKSFSLRVI